MDDTTVNLSPRAITPTPAIVLVALTLAAGIHCGAGGGGEGPGAQLPIAVGAPPGIDDNGEIIPTRDLSGLWRGSWRSDVTGHSGLLLDVAVHQVAADLSGSLRVTNSVQIDVTDHDGEVRGNDVRFTIGNVSRGRIDYRGTVEGIEIDGTWTWEAGGDAGTFHIKRTGDL